MTTQTSNSRQRTLIMALAGCGVLALCVCIIGAAAGGGYFFITNRSTTANEPAVEYILDASPRMAQPAEGGTRLSVAQAVLAEIVRPADASVTAGLRVFGSGVVAQSCQDTNLVVPLARANQSKIADSVFALDAGAAADSALAEAMIAAIRDLAATGGPHTLVVVTGGADSCSTQAGELIKQEAARAGISLQQFVIGFLVSDEEAQVIKAMTEETAGGAFLNAPDSDTLRNILLTIQNYIDHPSPPALALVSQAATPGAVIVIPPTPVAGTTPGGDGQAGPTSAAGSTPEPSATETATGYAAQTACDHPYLPLRPGATWTYSGDNFGYTWTVDSVAGDLNNATAVVTFSFEGGTITYHWACSPEGITYFQSVSMSMGEGFVSDTTITNQSGATLLSVANLKPGATWNSSYTMNYTFKGEGISGEVTSTISESHTAGAAQSLGAYADVIPVVSNGTYTTTSSFGSSSSSGVSTIYFARGVGIVRMESQFEGGSSTTELVSYNVPE